MLVAGGVGAAAVGWGLLWVLGDGGGGGGGARAAIRSVIRQNTRALDRQDLDGYMETIHPEAPGYDQTRVQMRRLFEEYSGFTSELTIESIELSGDDRAVATGVLTTRSADPAFDDVRTDWIHELRTHGGDWKIYATRAEDVEYVRVAPPRSDRSQQGSVAIGPLPGRGAHGADAAL